MGKLPRVTAGEIIKILQKIGFSLARQSGSHRIYKNAEGKRVTIPFHSGKKSILRDTGLTEEELKKLLNE